MVFGVESVESGLTPERGEALQPAVERESRTLPVRGTADRATRRGFCLCARCETTRRRIDGSG